MNLRILHGSMGAAVTGLSSDQFFFTSIFFLPILGALFASWGVSISFSLSYIIPTVKVCVCDRKVLLTFPPLPFNVCGDPRFSTLYPCYDFFCEERFDFKVAQTGCPATPFGPLFFLSHLKVLFNYSPPLCLHSSGKIFSPLSFPVSEGLCWFFDLSVPSPPL